MRHGPRAAKGDTFEIKPVVQRFCQSCRLAERSCSASLAFQRQVRMDACMTSGHICKQTKMYRLQQKMLSIQFPIWISSSISLGTINVRQCWEGHRRQTAARLATQICKATLATLLCLNNTKHLSCKTKTLLITLMACFI